MARRQNRTNNIGMRSVSGPARPYGDCLVCGRNKPMYWISKTEYRCYDCLHGRKVEPPVIDNSPLSFEQENSRKYGPPPEKRAGLENKHAKKVQERNRKKRMGIWYKAPESE